MGSIRWAVSLLLILTANSGCTPFTRIGEAKPAPVESRALIEQQERSIANRLFDEAFQELLDRSPQQQAYLGVRGNDDRWDDISDAFAVDTHKIVQRQWQNIKRSLDYGRLDRDTQLSYRLFQYNAQMEDESFRFRLHTYPANQLDGLQAEVPAFLINIHPAETEADLEFYIERLQGIRPLFNQLIVNLREREKRGIIIPLFVFPHVLADSRNVIKGRPFTDSNEDSTLLADFRAKCNRLHIAGPRQEELIRRAEAALLQSVQPAYAALIEYLVQLQGKANSDDGVWKFPEGAAYYAEALKIATTTKLSAEEIHQLGLREVSRIQGDITQVKQQVGFQGSVREFFDYLRTDPRFYFENTPDGRQAYLSMAVDLFGAMNARLDELFLRRPDADLVVKAVEPFREQSADKAFYSLPAPDGSRPGIFFLNLSNMGNMPIWELESLAYHEGIPGHHLQISIASALTDLPRFRRYGEFTAYIEGWALYMEQVPKELGFYSDPYSNFGRLAAELWRASRLVVDTGIHAKHWSREQAIQYLDDVTPSPHSQNVKAVERYIVMPAQATAYTIGMRKFLELRDRARERLGEGFDIRKFHDRILSAGPLPLAMLDEILEESAPAK